jgi:hypothetical protein
VLALCAGACIINRPYADLSPASASIRAGGTQAYTAVAISGDETSATTFNISPNGTGTGASCTANVCTATEAGNYLVSGTDGSIVGDTVNLTVDTDPGAPTVGTATAGNAEASVTFSPPSDNGGSAILNYTATAVDSTNSLNGGQSQTGSGSPIVVTGLTNGDSYTFTVTATNSVGTGPSSASSTR